MYLKLKSGIGSFYDPVSKLKIRNKEVVEANGKAALNRGRRDVVEATEEEFKEYQATLKVNNTPVSEAAVAEAPAKTTAKKTTKKAATKPVDEK